MRKAVGTKRCAVLEGLGGSAAFLLRPSLPHSHLQLQLTFMPDSRPWRNFVARFRMEIANSVDTLSTPCIVVTTMR